MRLLSWLLYAAAAILPVITSEEKALARPKRETQDKKIVCYYTNWSVYRPGTAKFSPQNINPYLCTHLIYAFGGLSKDNALKPFDKYQDIEQGGYAKFNGLKTYNKNLKTMLAIGGWNEGSARFSPLVADPERRKELVKNTIKFLRQNHFDGLDLDWEYPSFRDGGKPRDRDNYASLVQEFREEFERESEKTGRSRLLLTMAVPAGIEYIDKGYDVKKLNRYLDWMNILSYDYHSAFEPSINHHSPLFSLEEDDEYNFDAQLNIDYTVKHYIKLGADRSKLVLGIPTYGRSYSLFNPDATEIGAPADGPGEQGDATREKGYLAYYEICEKVKSEGWTVENPSPEAMGPYAFKGNQWVGYDDEDIVRAKSKYVNDMDLGGIMFWSIDNDDFRGKCHEKPYPLIEAAKEALLANANELIPTKSKGESRTAKKQDEETTQRSKSRTSRIRNKSSTTTESSKSKAGGRTTTTPQPPTTPDPGSDFICKDEGFFPHPRDCKKYFWCLDSGPSSLGIVAHQFTCPSGLVFNKVSDSCDYARNVICKIKPEAPATTATTTTSTTSTTTARTTTAKSRVITASPPRTTTTTTTTEQPVSEDEDIDEDEEDPGTIKELINLIKRLGGVEELEKQLNLQSSEGKEKIKPSLYSKVLQGRTGNRYRGVINDETTSPKYVSLFRNRPVGPQSSNNDETTTSNRVNERPKYVTIQRNRSTKRPKIDSESQDEEEEEEISEEETVEEQDQPKKKEKNYRPLRRRPTTDSTTEKEYVVLRRTRPQNNEETSTTSKYKNLLRVRSTTEAPSEEVEEEISDEEEDDEEERIIEQKEENEPVQKFKKYSSIIRDNKKVVPEEEESKVSGPQGPKSENGIPSTTTDYTLDARSIVNNVNKVLTSPRYVEIRRTKAPTTEPSESEVNFVNPSNENDEESKQSQNEVDEPEEKENDGNGFRRRYSTEIDRKSTRPYFRIPTTEKTTSVTVETTSQENTRFRGRFRSTTEPNESNLSSTKSNNRYVTLNRKTSAKPVVEEDDSNFSPKREKVFRTSTASALPVSESSFSNGASKRFQFAPRTKPTILSPKPVQSTTEPFTITVPDLLNPTVSENGLDSSPSSLSYPSVTVEPATAPSVVDSTLFDEPENDVGLAIFHTNRFSPSTRRVIPTTSTQTTVVTSITESSFTERKRIIVPKGTRFDSEFGNGYSEYTTTEEPIEVTKPSFRPTRYKTLLRSTTPITESTTEPRRRRFKFKSTSTTTEEPVKLEPRFIPKKTRGFRKIVSTEAPELTSSSTQRVRFTPRSKLRQNDQGSLEPSNSLYLRFGNARRKKILSKQDEGYENDLEVDQTAGIVGDSNENEETYILGGSLKQTSEKDYLTADILFTNSPNKKGDSSSSITKGEKSNDLNRKNIFTQSSTESVGNIAANPALSLYTRQPFQRSGEITESPVSNTTPLQAEGSTPEEVRRIVYTPNPNFYSFRILGNQANDALAENDRLAEGTDSTSEIKEINVNGNDSNNVYGESSTSQYTNSLNEATTNTVPITNPIYSVKTTQSERISTYRFNPNLSTLRNLESNTQVPIQNTDSISGLNREFQQSTTASSSDHKTFQTIDSTNDGIESTEPDTLSPTQVTSGLSGNSYYSNTNAFEFKPTKIESQPDETIGDKLSEDSNSVEEENNENLRSRPRFISNFRYKIPQNNINPSTESSTLSSKSFQKPSTNFPGSRSTLQQNPNFSGFRPSRPRNQFVDSDDKNTSSDDFDGNNESSDSEARTQDQSNKFKPRFKFRAQQSNENSDKATGSSFKPTRTTARPAKNNIYSGNANLSGIRQFRPKNQQTNAANKEETEGVESATETRGQSSNRFRFSPRSRTSFRTSQTTESLEKTTARSTFQPFKNNNTYTGNPNFSSFRRNSLFRVGNGFGRNKQLQEQQNVSEEKAQENSENETETEEEEPVNVTDNIATENAVSSSSTLNSAKTTQIGNGVFTSSPYLTNTEAQIAETAIPNQQNTFAGSNVNGNEFTTRSESPFTTPEENSNELIESSVPTTISFESTRTTQNDGTTYVNIPSLPGLKISEPGSSSPTFAYDHQTASQSIPSIGGSTADSANNFVTSDVRTNPVLFNENNYEVTENTSPSLTSFQSTKVSNGSTGSVYSTVPGSPNFRPLRVRTQRPVNINPQQLNENELEPALESKLKGFKEERNFVGNKRRIVKIRPSQNNNNLDAASPGLTRTESTDSPGFGTREPNKNVVPNPRVSNFRNFRTRNQQNNEISQSEVVANDANDIKEESESNDETRTSLTNSNFRNFRGRTSKPDKGFTNASDGTTEDKGYNAYRGRTRQFTQNEKTTEATVSSSLPERGVSNFTPSSPRPRFRTAKFRITESSTEGRVNGISSTLRSTEQPIINNIETTYPTPRTRSRQGISESIYTTVSSAPTRDQNSEEEFSIDPSIGTTFGDKLTSKLGATVSLSSVTDNPLTGSIVYATASLSPDYRSKPADGSKFENTRTLPSSKTTAGATRGSSLSTYSVNLADGTFTGSTLGNRQYEYDSVTQPTVFLSSIADDNQYELNSVFPSNRSQPGFRSFETQSNLGQSLPSSLSTETQEPFISNDIPSNPNRQRVKVVKTKVRQRINSTEPITPTTDRTTVQRNPNKTGKVILSKEGRRVLVRSRPIQPRLEAKDSEDVPEPETPEEFSSTTARGSLSRRPNQEYFTGTRTRSRTSTASTPTTSERPERRRTPLDRRRFRPEARSTTVKPEVQTEASPNTARTNILLRRRPRPTTSTTTTTTPEPQEVQEDSSLEESKELEETPGIQDLADPAVVAIHTLATVSPGQISSTIKPYYPETPDVYTVHVTQGDIESITPGRVSTIAPGTIRPGSILTLKPFTFPIITKQTPKISPNPVRAPSPFKVSGTGIPIVEEEAYTPRSELPSRRIVTTPRSRPLALVTTAAPPKPARTRPGKVKPFSKVPKQEVAQSVSSPQPPLDYEYYDDDEETLANIPASALKVKVHSNGYIECLDRGNFPHPFSCKKFISCAKMENNELLGWEYTCPKNLSFDPVGGICNWSAGLGCQH